MFRCALAALALGLAAPGTSGQSPTKRDAMARAVDWLNREFRWEKHYDYVMGGEVRLLLVWVGEDDIGAGHIRVAESPTRAIELVFGSEPDKAPRGINRWGAVTEVLQFEDDPAVPVASAALGFRRKVSEPETLPEEGRTPPSADRQDLFEASLNYIEPRAAYAALTEFSTGRNFDVSHFPRVKEMTFSGLSEGGSEVRRLSEDESAKCGRVSSFLFTIQEVIEEIIRGRAEIPPRCYVYNAQFYTLQVVSNEPLNQKEIEITLENGDRLQRTYQELVDAELRVVNEVSGNETSFSLLLGTKAPYRGVPVQVTHSPNWWVRIILNLEGVSSLASAP